MSSEIKVDTISEKTSANGVVIDGVTLKDSKIGGTITIPGSTGTMALTSDISAGGLEEADLWFLTASTSSSGDLTSNLARNTGTLLSYKGTGMTESSGVFSFPSTGYWLVMAKAYMSSPGSGAGSAILYTVATNDNFTSEDRIGINRIYESSDNNYTTTFGQVIIDVTDISNDKIKFEFIKSGDGQIQGTTDPGTSSNFSFLKLGDT